MQFYPPKPTWLGLGDLKEQERCMMQDRLCKITLPHSINKNIFGMLYSQAVLFPHPFLLHIVSSLSWMTLASWALAKSNWY